MRVAEVDVVCLGIVVADVVVRPIDAQPQSGTLTLADSVVLRAGGSALSTASVLARLGLRSAVLGKTGADAFGDFLVRVVAERDVDGSGIVQDPAVPTSASVVLVDSKGERTFLHTIGANGAVRAGELGDAPFRGRALHIAGALVLEELDGDLGGGVSWQRFIARLVAHGPVSEFVPGSILQTAPTDYTILGGVADDVEIHMA